VVQLKALRTLVTHEPAAVEGALGEAIQLAQNGLEESRKAIQALRADPLAVSGLTSSVRSALQAFQTRTGVFAELDVEGEESELTSEEAQAFYRIVEEALTNVERHASAQHVRVRLAFGADHVNLVVWDDGVGFDRATVGPDRYGLTSMRERAALIHATLGVQSAPGSGTVVQCSLRK
jgi:signal transduction histidine kinase